MGICRYDDVSQTITCAFGLGHNSDVVDICEDARGHLWFASLGKGLIRYGFDDGGSPSVRTIPGAGFPIS